MTSEKTPSGAAPRLTIKHAETRAKEQHSTPDSLESWIENFHDDLLMESVEGMLDAEMDAAFENYLGDEPLDALTTADRSHTNPSPVEALERTNLGDDEEQIDVFARTLVSGLFERPRTGRLYPPQEAVAAVAAVEEVSATSDTTSSTPPTRRRRRRRSGDVVGGVGCHLTVRRPGKSNDED